MEIMVKKATKGKCGRKEISKSLRFEVFKRDHFTCQYCGRKSPDVVLQIDHIKPVSKGGENDILNLVTSCVDCNLGKSDRTLDDQSVIVRKQKQAKFLADRLEQIEMLRDWHIELANQENIEVEAVNSLYKSLTNDEFIISEYCKNTTISKLIKKYGLALVLEALSDGAKSYGDPDKALEKLPGICACKSDPIIARKSFILNKMNKHYRNFKRQEAAMILAQGYAVAGERFLNAAEDMIYDLDGTWWGVKEAYYELLRLAKNENA